MDRQTCPDRQHLLLYRAAPKGTFGEHHAFPHSSITDALFVYLDGEPEEESIATVEEQYRVRPLVGLTEGWENYIREHHPEAAVYRRFMMIPTKTFTLPEAKPLPEGYRLTEMDEKAFSLHPFSHGENYPDYESFRKEGSGAVVYHNEEIVASASSFLSLEGEAELDVSTEESHRKKGLAEACVIQMLRDCMNRGITVHWDAQNEISLHMAEKYGFELETEYSVYWLPEKA